MEWMLGIITALLLDIVLILTGNVWVTYWIFGAGVLWVVFIVVKGIRDDGRERRDARREAKRAAQKPLDFRSFMGMGR